MSVCASSESSLPDKSDWLRVRNEFSAHAQKIGPGQRSGFLVLTKKSAASVDENSHEINMAAIVEDNSVCNGAYFASAKLHGKWRAESLNLNLIGKMKQKSDFKR